MTNAGEEAAIIVGKVLENNTDTFGYNTATGEFGDLIALGIVDPVKVVRSALQNISFIASLLITTEIMIAETFQKDALASLIVDGEIADGEVNRVDC
ncbi:chaperonin GroEL (HSP60 family) [Bartonella japonica]|uniref:Chaperonin GroEL (HSP60 family) n=1 Tax=Bartonella japonica TaxID=357761 RepID=A0ABV2FQ67_9HYPH